MKRRRNLPFGYSSTEDGHLIMRLPEEPVSGDDLDEGEYALSLDSANSRFIVRTKLPGGALVCGTIGYGGA